jgi:hypothetical protein
MSSAPTLQEAIFFAVTGTSVVAYAAWKLWGRCADPTSGAFE